MFVKIPNADTGWPVIVNLGHVVAIETVKVNWSNQAQIVFRCTSGSYNVFVATGDLEEWLTVMASMIDNASIGNMPERMIDLTVIPALVESRRQTGGAHA